MPPTSRRIVIDARPLSHPQVGGFRTYVRSLVQGLAEVGGAEEILLYLDRPLPPDAPALPPNAAVRILDRDRLRSDLLLFRKQVRWDRPDVVHGTMNYLPPGIAAPTTVTIHDALEIKRYPFVPRPRTRRARLMRAYSAFLTRTSARRARYIVTDSAASAAEIRSALGRPLPPIAVVHCAILAPPPDPAARRSDDVVLALASTDPRKNFDLLLRAVASHRARGLSPRPCLQIVCTNAASAAGVRDEARRHGIGDVDLVHGLSDAALADCYARAALFVFPSRMEGFGLPPLEAMAAGCPVASSSAPPMPEVLADIPVWFSPDDPEALADGIATLLQDPERRREMGRRGQDHAAQFTCRRMAEPMLETWRALAAQETNGSRT